MSNFKNVVSFLKTNEQVNKEYGFNYESILNQIQEVYAKKYYDLITANNVALSDKKDKVISFFVSEIKKMNILSQISDITDLASRLYSDMEGFSVLDAYLFNDDVEGININAWDNIRIKFHGGISKQIDGFSSPAQAKSIMKKLLLESNVTMDDAVPMAEASLGANIRITSVQTPIVDEHIGVAGYIRRLRKEVFKVDEYIKSGFTVGKALNLIHICARRGVSMMFCGTVNTGKTTLVKNVLDTLPDEMQILTIETGSREMDLVKKSNEGKTINNILHMLTRENEIENQNITQEKLVVKSLRLNPDILSVAEMRDVEASACQEASLTGHCVITTLHAGSPKQAHRRVAGLCRKKHHTDYQEAITNAVNAFPLVVFIHLGEDNIRRIMNISEAFVDDNEKIHYNTLWEFQIYENLYKDGRVFIKGEHKQISSPSDNLIKHMKLYGISDLELKSIMMNEGE